MRKGLFGSRRSATLAETKFQQVRDIIANVNVPNGTTKKIAAVIG